MARKADFARFASCAVARASSAACLACTAESNSVARSSACPHCCASDIRKARVSVSNVVADAKVRPMIPIVRPRATRGIAAHAPFREGVWALGAP